MLSEPELVEVWRACLDDDFGRIVRLLILTLQRRSEIADLANSEIDAAERQIRLPGYRTKNGREHIVPLSDFAWEILESVDRREGREFLFGRGARGFGGWSKSKGELDEHERRLALGLWASPLLSLIEGKSSNVIPLKATKHG